MWSEGDNYDLALSFQEKAGCDEIWEKICQVSSAACFFTFSKKKKNERSLVIFCCISYLMFPFRKRRICLMFNKSIIYLQTLTKSLMPVRLVSATIVCFSSIRSSKLSFFRY